MSAMFVALVDLLKPFVEACAEVARVLDEPEWRQQVSAVKSEIDKIDRSWCGSTLGYHGNVFYEGLEPPPQGAFFSVEWGLARQGQFDGTRGNWREYRSDDIRAEVFRRAKVSDFRDKLTDVSKRCKRVSDELKHEVLSTVDAIISNSSDPTLVALRGQISELSDVDYEPADLGLLNSSVMSRDMRAVSEGVRVLPAHRLVAAEIEFASEWCRQVAVLVGLVRRLDSYVRKKELVRSMTNEIVVRDRSSVFVIFGRNSIAFGELEKFLLSVGLRPLGFQEARRKAGAQPSVFDVVKFGVSTAQVVIALFTPDEWSSLAPELRLAADKEHEKSRWQARPNVAFEAGLAMGLNPNGTILVTLGGVDLPSDISGLHQFRLSNDAPRRQELKLLLKQLGCSVDEEGTHFLEPGKSGDFAAPTMAQPRDAFSK